MALSLSRLGLPAFPRRELRYAKVILDDYRRRMLPAPVKPTPNSWSDQEVTAAWLGHSTVLVNFFGVTILTDPVLGARAGLGLGPLVLGPKRYVRSALTFSELPPIDLILLTHAHMDHFDLPTLRRFDRRPLVVTAAHTGDLLRGTRLRGHVSELAWGESIRLKFSRTAYASTVERGELEIEAFEVQHWGARMRHDDHRGYNGYILRRGGRALLCAGDTAYTSRFRRLRGRGGEALDGGFDLAVMPIGAYDPWVTSHCNPEEAVEMADDAGARYLLPVHHQTFKLSREPMDDPIRRFERALARTPARVALRRVGETFRLPLD
jgi:L-ascorbate metabolism protein UlaG (beta-lactamase superfamily)